jgi:hypothetical protein
MTKNHQLLWLGGTALAGVAFVAVAALQPFAVAKAADASLISATAQSATTFSSTYRVTTPSAAGDFTGAAIATAQEIITYNRTNPLPSFSIWNGSEEHVVQGCVIGFGNQTIIYGSNSMQHYFRTQLISTTEPSFTPFGFFVGIHGIRKIQLITVGASRWIGNQGQLSMAVCLASLDGSVTYNMSDKEKETAITINTDGTTITYTIYTITLPDTMSDSVPTQFTARWLYIGGAFISHNLGTDYSSEKEEDKNTYYCDLASFTAYFDGTC